MSRNMFSTFAGLGVGLFLLGASSGAQAVTGLNVSVYHNILPFTDASQAFTPTDATISAQQAYTASATADYTFVNSVTAFGYSGAQAQIRYW